MKFLLLFLLSTHAILFAQNEPFKASETFLVWPAVPPGSLAGDDSKADTVAKEIHNNTYKIPKGNRLGTNIPTVDVYLPAKEKQTGTAILIFCGGGYGAVCIQSEGLPIAKYLITKGITVFMVSYRCKPYKHPVPLWDVQRALRLVRHRAKDFNIKPAQIGVMGFSAGGHVTASLSVLYNENFGRKAIDEIDKLNARPSFTCLIYPVISMRDGITHNGSRRNLLGQNQTEELIAKLSTDEQVDKNTPPAFLAHAIPDKTVNVDNSKRYYEACIRHGVPSKIMLMPQGKHGPGFHEGKPNIRDSKEGYADAMVDWIKKILDQSK
jgi:acetyl esterase/lipase